MFFQNNWLESSVLERTWCSSRKINGIAAIACNEIVQTVAFWQAEPTDGAVVVSLCACANFRRESAP